MPEIGWTKVVRVEESIAGDRGDQIGEPRAARVNERMEEFVRPFPVHSAYLSRFCAARASPSSGRDLEQITKSVIPINVHASRLDAKLKDGANREDRLRKLHGTAGVAVDCSCR
jgi:hypothetical protein